MTTTPTQYFGLARCQARKDLYGSWRGFVTLYNTEGPKRRRLWSVSVPIWRLTKEDAIEDAKREADAIARHHMNPEGLRIA